jgi:hypothetical protein
MFCTRGDKNHRWELCCNLEGFDAAVHCPTLLQNQLRYRRNRDREEMNDDDEEDDEEEEEDPKPAMK